MPGEGMPLGCNFPFPLAKPLPLPSGLPLGFPFEVVGYPEKVLCTQYPSTRCSTHFFFPARLENPYEGIIVVQW